MPFAIDIRCEQSPVEAVSIKICQVSGNAWVSLKPWTFDGLTQTDRLWLWWSLVYDTSSMLCCVRLSANLRLAQPLPVGQQDPSKTKGRTATRLNCVLPGLPPISPNQNQQNLNCFHPTNSKFTWILFLGEELASTSTVTNCPCTTILFV